jgi:hypothetical protein
MATRVSQPALVSVTTGPPVLLNINDNLITTVAVIVTGTNSSDLEVTLDDIGTPAAQALATWIKLPAPWTGIAATRIGTIGDNNNLLQLAVTAVRLNMTAFTSGGAVLKVLQGDAN